MGDMGETWNAIKNAGDILQRELEAMGADAWADPVAFCAGETGLIKESEDFTQCDKGVVYKIQADAVLIEDTAARPAWRDGDGWFVLPDGWWWETLLWGGRFRSDAAHFGAYVEYNWIKCKWSWYLPRFRDCVGPNVIESGTEPTAPAAFRAAEAEIAKPSETR